MQYGDPATSAGSYPGSADSKLSVSAVFVMAMATPAGLRCQTPISHTASYPAKVSQVSSGTPPRSTRLPARSLKAPSHGSVLIS